jgi:putative FmdB family regulatory protein
VPTYEYECSGCGRVFEIRQRISEPPLSTCDACGGQVRRLLSPAPFILKGGGWYVTDYPSEARKKALESEKGSGAKTPSDGGDKSKADAPKGDAPKSAAEKSGTTTPSSSTATSTD